MTVIMIAAPPILSLTIRKSQDTDDQKEGDNHQKTNTEVIVRVLIIPAILKTMERLYSQLLTSEFPNQWVTWHFNTFNILKCVEFITLRGR